jgi:unsaturated chondroitin disaccharide hydrolase
MRRSTHTRRVHRSAARLALGAAALLGAACRTPPAAVAAPHATRAAVTPLDSLVERSLEYAQAQLRRSAGSLDPADGYPRSTRPDGTWSQLRVPAWTSGFFPGQLWYMFDLTRDPHWRAQAERWTAGLERMKTVRNTHDLGFVLFDSFGHGYRLTGDPHYRAVILEGSRTLVQRFNPAVGAIKSWDTETRPDHRSQWTYPVIVDNLMNLEMLFWAARNGGDPAWARLAERHALVSARAHVRDDGSTAHVALFDPATGAFERRVTWQGHADSSAWARGQAWAVHGLAASYRETRNPELLAAARRSADWFIAHLPADAVPYWDFRHPDIPNTERDASAAAIASSGLFELARLTEGADARRYRAAAERILASLATSYTTRGTPSRAILLHSVGHRPQNDEVDVGISYADYYFVEALMRYRGQR